MTRNTGPQYHGGPALERPLESALAWGYDKYGLEPFFVKQIEAPIMANEVAKLYASPQPTVAAAPPLAEGPR